MSSMPGPLDTVRRSSVPVVARPARVNQRHHRHRHHRHQSHRRPHHRNPSQALISLVRTVAATAKAMARDPPERHRHPLRTGDANVAVRPRTTPRPHTRPRTRLPLQASEGNITTRAKNGLHNKRLAKGSKQSEQVLCYQRHRLLRVYCPVSLVSRLLSLILSHTSQKVKPGSVSRYDTLDSRIS